MSLIDRDTRDDYLAPEELLAEGYLAASHSVPAATDLNVRTELASILHFILNQYLRPSTLRHLIGPRDSMIGQVMLGRSMQGEIDGDLLARILAQALVEHIRQSGFVVRRPSVGTESGSFQ